MKKNIENSIKDGLIMSPITNRIFLALNAANINPSKSSPDAIDIKKLAGGICGEALVKDYIGCKKWINE